MTLLSTAFKELKRHFIMNFITFVELTVSIILVCVMVSSVMIRYKYYEPFSDMYNSKGLYCELISASPKGINFENMKELIADDEIFPYLHSPEMIVSSNKVWAYIMNGDVSLPCDCYSYNDELIKRFCPQLSEGNWLDTNMTGDTIKAVISENDYGWKVGDKIPVNFFGEYEDAVQVEIIGKIPNGIKLPGIAQEHNGENNSNMFFSTFDLNEDDTPLIIFSYSQLKEQKIVQSLYSAMIKYPENTTQEDLFEDQKTIATFTGVFSMKLSEINENSISYFKMQAYNYLPIILVVLTLTFVSSISITAISTRRRLHDYGIYYVCGLKWKSCSVVNLFYSVIIGAISIASAVTIMLVMDKIPILKSITVLWNMWTFLAIGVVMILFIIGSMIMPMIIIGSSTPKEILTRGDV